MYINLEVSPYTIQKTTPNYIETKTKKRFNVLNIGKDSYICEAVVENGINLRQEKFGVHNIQIGKYSALAEKITFLIDVNHDYLSVCQGCISELKGRHPDFKIKRKGQVIIENDVWIGHGATIMGGVTIHNGALVAANAVVTKDVPPYAIVAGNPARVVKYRFSEDIIQKLLKISWWNWSSQQILECGDDILGDIEAFVDKYYENAEMEYKDVLTMENPVSDMSSGEKYLLIPDFADEYPLYPRIIESFCKNFNNRSEQLIIYLNTHGEEELKKLSDELSKYEDYNVYVQIIDGETTSIEATIANVDKYITDRGLCTIDYIEIAEKYSTQIISGVDVPLF